jgi:acetyl-CoA carboxylase biotin carboxylase subunit
MRRGKKFVLASKFGDLGQAPSKLNGMATKRRPGYAWTMSESLAIHRILVANRGEIAIRVIRACRDLGLESVAIYSEADREALHVRFATYAYPVGEATATDSYLNIDRVLQAAHATKADAIHPGYGFLSENSEFARRCEDEGLIFIGPTAECMALVGNKARARQCAIDAGVPVVPGSPDPVENIAEAQHFAEKIGYPIMLKAAAGGGGKGMRLVENDAELDRSFETASSEALSAFGNGRIYVEKAIVTPRHVEIQILADLHGNQVHLGERECTLQRRHQKVLEEAPSPVVNPELRKQMGEAALMVAMQAEYSNAGTVEFLLDSDRKFYFIEVNARLQVEHPVTELLTGIDLVAEQISLAQGKKLSFGQEDVEFRGHAIECRIYAEDPDNDFAPSPGVIKTLNIPSGPGIRDDSCLFEGYNVPIHYDPIVGKLIAWGADRLTAIRRLQRALTEYKIRGVATTIPLFQRVLADSDFINANFDTGYLDRLLNGASEPTGSITDDCDSITEVARLAAAVHIFLNEEHKAYRPLKAPGSPWKIAGRTAALDREP